MNSNFLICCMILPAVLQCGRPSGTVEGDPVTILQKVARCGEFWVQVHAIEFLAGSGYQTQAASLIASDLEAADSVPQKRIGVWRASYMAASTEKDARRFLNKIVRAYLDTTGPDRIHAAESLSKLGYSLRGIPPGILQSDLAKGGMLAAFVRWGMAIPDIADTSPDYDHLFRQLNDEDAEMRKLAAYALGFIGAGGKRSILQKTPANSNVQTNVPSGINEEKNQPSYQLPEDKWLILAKLSVEEDPASEAYPYLLGAAYSLFPFGSGSRPPEIIEIRNKLLALANKHDKSSRIELCRALAVHAEPGDAIILQDLLRLRSPIVTISGEKSETIAPDHPWNQDVQSAAAYALLSRDFGKKNISINQTKEKLP